MKRIIKDALFGLLVIIAVTILEFIVTIPFGEPAQQITDEVWTEIINRELLLTAIPAALTTFAFTGFMKTKSKEDAIRRGIIWTIMMALNYAFIGIGNNNFKLIFGGIGIYILLVCTFIGPVIFTKVKHLS